MPRRLVSAESSYGGHQHAIALISAAYFEPAIAKATFRGFGRERVSPEAGQLSRSLTTPHA